MGGSAYKERVNRCRKFCAVSLALPRGSTSTAEPVLMTLARKLAAKTAKEEWVQVHPPSWTQAWVQDQWDLLVRGETETATRDPLPSARPVDSKHLQDRACDLYASTVRDAIKKEADTLKKTTRGMRIPMATHAKRVQWRRWRALTPRERESWVARLDSETSCRTRGPTGMFVKTSVVDAVPLAAFAPASASSESTPKKRKPMGAPPTPEKFLQRELAEIGKGFLSRVGPLLENVPLKTSIGPEHLLRTLATEVKRCTSSTRAWKGIAFSRGESYKNKFLNSFVTVRRAKRQKTVSDEFIRTALLPACRDTRSMDKKFGTPFMALTTTLKAACEQSKELESKLAYKTVAKRINIHKPKLGIGRARRRVDLCMVCRCWDAVALKRLQAHYNEWQRSLLAACPLALQGWEALCTSRGWGSVKAQLDSSRFLVAFQHYLQGGFGHAAFKASLPEDVSVMLAMNEALVVEEVDRQIHVVTMFETHWRLRDHVFSELHKAMSSSDTHKLRFWMDWQDCWVNCTDNIGKTSLLSRRTANRPVG